MRARTHARMHMYISNYTFIIIVTYAYIYYIIFYSIILYYIYMLGVTGLGHHLCNFFFTDFDARIRAPGPAVHRPSS